MVDFLSGMAGGATVAIIIKAVDEFSDIFTKAKIGAEGLSKSTIAAFAGVAVAATAAYAAINIGLAKTVDSFSTFDKEIQRAGANVNASAETLQKFRDAAIDAGKKSSISFEDAGKALSLLAGGTVSADEAIKALQPTIDFATANNLDLQKATLLSSQAMVLFGKSGMDLNHILDILTKSGQISYATTEQMADAFSEAAPLAAQLGMNVDDLAAVLGAMADAGYVGSEAGVALKRAFKELLDPSKETKETLEKLGLTVDEVSKLLPTPIKLIQLLEERFNTIKDPIERATLMSQLFGQISGPAMAALLGLGSEAITDYSTRLDTASGSLDDMTKRIDDARSPLELLGKEFEALKIQLGQNLAEPLREFVNILSMEFVPILQQMIPVVKEFFTNSLQIGIEVLRTLWTVIEPLVPAFFKLADVLANFVVKSLATLQPILRAVAELAGVLLDDAIVPLLEPLAEISSLFINLVVLALTPFLPLVKAVTEILKGFAPVIQGICTAIGTLIGWISDLIGWINKITFGTIFGEAQSIAGITGTTGTAGTTTAPGTTIPSTGQVTTTISHSTPAGSRAEASQMGRSVQELSGGSWKEKDFVSGMEWTHHSNEPINLTPSTPANDYSNPYYNYDKAEYNRLVALYQPWNTKWTGRSDSVEEALAKGYDVTPGTGMHWNEKDSSGAIYMHDFILTPKGQIIKPSPTDTIMGSEKGFGNSINIYIDKVQGVDADDIAEALERELRRMIRI